MARRHHRRRSSNAARAGFAVAPRQVALAVGGAILLYTVAVNGIARTTAVTAPELALRVAPGDAEALAARSAMRLTPDATSADLKAANEEAERSLRRSLVSPEALATMTFTADLARQKAKAGQFANLSDALSRRNLATRLWLIENEVQKENVAGALGNFDVALRTNPRAQTILFPVLDNALKDDQLLDPIAKVIAERPHWAGHFAYYVATSGTATVNLARLLLRVGYIPSYPGADVRGLLIERLVAQNQFAPARRLARSVPLAPGQFVVDPRFTDGEGDPPFTWDLADTPDLSAQRGGTAASGLQVSAGIGVGGRAARQVISLSPGRYRLAARRSGEALAANQSPLWTVACTSTANQALAILPMATSTAVATDFAVPVGCRDQWLSLEVRGVDTPGGLSFAAESVQITPVP